MQQAARYDIAKMLHDAATEGWLPIDLIRKTKGISFGYGYKFLRGETSNPRIAEKLTKTLKKPKGYYLLKREVAA